MEKKINKNEFKFLKNLQNKKYRDLEKKFIIEGQDAIDEAIKVGKRITIYSSNLKIKADKYLDYELLCKILNSVTPQEVFAVVDYLEERPIKGDVVALDHVQDPGNLGTIIRNCVSFGVKNLLVNGVNIYNDKVLRSTKGAIFNINIIQSKNLINDIKYLKNTHQIIGTLLDKNAKSIVNFKPKNNYVLIFGNESKGISFPIQELLDERVYIPINFESLNVAISNAIALYELKGRKENNGYKN
ncbi:TrmH family RNA methyltransferase [Mycoplasma phocimorsus]|uniref:TrmH family RNA methyltransferase n=1 Tax=Mycoplasma phocimorsus TaxID=3045839 RepID=UPI0024C064B7|nr:RNA methyltransferase [Mycoplasma phocimorsus]MDJ1647744.1 RNA methyltransferase [Mycoplasma phocimorsus]